MDKLKNALSVLAEKVFREFVERGGVLTENGRPLDPAVAASPQGGLPALLWLTRKFYADFQIEFAPLEFVRDPAAITGYALSDIDVSNMSASDPLLKLSDFLQQEMLPSQPMNVVESDLGVLFHDFRQWGDQNVAQSPSQDPGAPDPQAKP